MRLLLPLALTAVLVTGCSEASNAVSGATDCAARDTAAACGLPADQFLA